jgi:hypothetical protein
VDNTIGVVFFIPTCAALVIAAFAALYTGYTNGSISGAAKLDASIAPSPIA